MHTARDVSLSYETARYYTNDYENLFFWTKKCLVVSRNHVVSVLGAVNSRRL